MSDTTPSLPARQRLKLKILLPMSLGLLIFLGLYIASTSYYLDREIDREISQQIADINANFDSLIEQRAQIMRVQLEQLAESEELQKLMIARDRDGLLKASQNTFRQLLLHLRISHFYFHSPDQTVFLRVHNPPRHSDLITRHSLQETVKTGRYTRGIELGPLGTFTLRTVLPWEKDGQLIGYLELGEEIELLLSSFFRHTNTALTLTIDKRYLDYERWVVGAKMLNKDPEEWNLLEDKIVLQSSLPELLPSLIEILGGSEKKDNFKISHGGQTFQGVVQPLRDSLERQVGEFIVLRDITITLNEYWRTVIAFTCLCFIAAGGFLFITAIRLGKIERQLETTDKQLVDEMYKVHKTNTQLENEIDERKNAEEALNKIHDELEERVTERTEQLWLSLEQTQQVRKQLTDIVTSVPDGLIVTGTDNRILLVNKRAEELFQCSLEECDGKPLRSIIRDPAIAEKMEDSVKQQLNDLQFELNQITSDLQSTIALQVRTSALTDNNDKTVGMIFLLHDISQEREIERLKSEFITTAVHELSTPLTAILGYSEFLLENPELSPEEHKEFLTIIYEKSDFLSGLVGELLDISRIESGKPLDLSLLTYGVEELFEKPIQHLQQLSSEHQFSIELQQPENKLVVDKEKIWQVMENLSSNAVKYSPAGGNITVRGENRDKYYRVTVSDKGVGLTPEQAGKVFEKFYRCNQSDTAIGGTGLGLTIVKHIVESHNGRIWIDSELGVGTNVHFELPLFS